MSYYMGDYYPRGDPGIGSFFAGLAKKAVGFIPGVGPALSAIIPDIGKARPVAQVAAPAAGAAAGAITAAAKSAITKARGVIVKHPVLSAAGAAGALGGTMGAVAGRMSASQRAAAGLPRKRRRMNSCNPRALRRAVRRLHSFARHYRKTVGFVTPHPKKGRMYFKRRKK